MSRGGEVVPRRREVWGLSVALCAAAAGLAALHAPFDSPTSAPVGLALVFVALVETQILRVRLFYGGRADDLNFFESAAAVVFVALTPGQATVFVAGATLIACVVQRIVPTKTLFNVGQWSLAVAAGASVYRALHPSADIDAAALGAILVGLAVVVLVNQMALSTVQWLAYRHPLGTPLQGLAKRALLGRLASALTASCVGLILAAAYRASYLTLVAAIVPLWLLHWASKGYAAVQADRARLAGLQRATHALSAALDVDRGLADFVGEVRRSFEVDVATVWLTRPDGVTLAAVATADGADLPQSERWRHLAQQLIDVARPVRARVGDGSETGALLAGAEARDCLAVPLMDSGQPVGLLVTANRLGLEGFEDGEVAVLEAMAAELASALHRARLVGDLVEERRTLAQIIGSTSDGIFTVAGDGLVTSWNDAMARITGFPAEDMVSRRSVPQLRIRDARGQLVLLERWAEAGYEQLVDEVQIITAGGETVWLSCSYSPVSTGPGGELVVIARNITQARELERLKDDFVAVVSHELRTPLSPIKGWASTLLARGERMSAEQKAEGLHAIVRQAQRLEQLILNILEASRIEAGAARPDREVCDLAAVAAKVVEDHAASWPDRIRLHGADVARHVHGQQVWVERAVSNLVSNALKYSPSAEPVDVRLDPRDGEVVLAVTDRGPGIAPADRERVFGRFERLDHPATQTGTGLGLYITRQLARAMGGAVGVDSVPGAGSTFWLRLRATSGAEPDADVTRAGSEVWRAT